MDGAAYYEVEIADNEGYHNPVDKGVTVNGRYTPDKKVESLQYFWRVRMVDADGRAGPYETGRVAGKQHVTYLPTVQK